MSHWFRGRDFASFCLPSLLIAGAGLLGLTNGRNSGNPAVWFALVAGFIGLCIYGVLLYKRYVRYSADLTTPTYGLRVKWGEGLPGRYEAWAIDKEVLSFIERWVRAKLPWIDGNDLRGVLVIFSTSVSSGGTDVAGVFNESERVIHVKYDQISARRLSPMSSGTSSRA